MPRWHGRQRAAMGRTVVSLITLAHRFGINVPVDLKDMHNTLLDVRREVV
ncbi:hypothetical protein [Shewanella baltica]|nr:hypothetical protein [Shewanella baltica]